MQEVLPPEQAGQICVDGKTLRGSGPKPLHVVSALASATGLSLGQVAGVGKGQELGAVPDLLALLNLRGALVSLDAPSCQPAIAGQITAHGGDYLLGLKANQPRLLAEAGHHTAGSGFYPLGVRSRPHPAAVPGLDPDRPALGRRRRALAGPGDAGAGADHQPCQ